MSQPAIITSRTRARGLRAPVWPFEIDADSPLAEGLSTFLVFGAGAPYDLIGRQTYALTGGGSIGLSLAGDNLGYRNPSDSQYINLGALGTFDCSVGVTLAAYMSPDLTPQFGAWFANRTGGVVAVLSGRAAEVDEVHSMWNGAGYDDDGAVYTAGVPGVFGCSFTVDGSSNPQQIRFHSQDFVHAESTTTAGTGTTATISAMRVGMDSAAAARTMHGEWAWAAVYDSVALDSTMREELGANPWAMVSRRGRNYFLPTAAVGGGGFNAGFAAGSNVVIQPGAVM